MKLEMGTSGCGGWPMRTGVRLGLFSSAGEMETEMRIENRKWTGLAPSGKLEGLGVAAPGLIESTLEELIKVGWL